MTRQPLLSPYKDLLPLRSDIFSDGEDATGAEHLCRVWPRVRGMNYR
jgi:hypothetical protein